MKRREIDESSSKIDTHIDCTVHCSDGSRSFYCFVIAAECLSTDCLVAATHTHTPHEKEQLTISIARGRSLQRRR